MPSVTFFSLLAAGNKVEVYEKRLLLTIATYPHMAEDQQEQVRDDFQLPDDFLNDILESEIKDDINMLKEALEGE